ncbi:MAG: hypothetical protein WAS23_05505 [Dokdonella sp.]|uniref:COG4705 family protein n=1 Tax=Dokdonella sp. TaxID=2291710 RepID=UPI002C641637|nr:hypothetical protein [Dokdonella sp.]HOX71657.1 hypothetical protein [Dokdonella sp.]HPG93142.1 hypothetical protein [Dokdonella sp.]HPN78217.1 hypothetical protein [Dokdonella sp.]
MTSNPGEIASKVPEANAAFWIIKILATTLGETGGDAVSMSMHLGYLVGTAIFCVIFIAAVSAQIATKTFRPVPYWITIIATTTVGTTAADFATRSLGIGYPGGSLILLGLLLACLYAWHKALGSIAIDSIHSPRSERFYWLTILFSQTLGTALGDWTAIGTGIGFGGATLVFGTALAAIAAARRWTQISRTALFWGAFILTRPLGAVVGDLLDKPLAEGGLALSRYAASAAILALIVLLVAILPQRPARQPA